MSEWDDGDGDESPFSVEVALLETLQRRTGLSAQILIELQRKGPVYALIRKKMDAAMVALVALIEADPSDSAKIAAAQARFNSFAEDAAWVRGILEDGKEADKEILERWGEEDGGDDQNRTKGRRGKR